MKKLIYLIMVIAILGLIVSGCSIPLKSVVPTSEKGNPKPELGAPVIERGVFVDHGYSSPPWYPPEEETDRYQWGPKLHWASTGLPIDCMVYTFGTSDGAFDAVMQSFAEWDEYTSATIYGTVEEDDDEKKIPPGAVFDKENTISWGEIDGSGGIIAITYYWYWVNTKELVEFDIIFDIADLWGTGSGDFFDIQNVATHEIGHTLVLGDLRSPKDGALTMHAYTWLGDTVKRTLGSGDILGVQAIYGE
jgi:hypothetical protein